MQALNDAVMEMQDKNLVTDAQTSEASTSRMSDPPGRRLSKEEARERILSRHDGAFRLLSK